MITRRMRPGSYLRVGDQDRPRRPGSRPAHPDPADRDRPGLLHPRTRAALQAL